MFNLLLEGMRVDIQLPILGQDVDKHRLSRFSAPNLTLSHLTWPQLHNRPRCPSCRIPNSAHKARDGNTFTSNPELRDLNITNSNSTNTNDLTCEECPKIRNKPDNTVFYDNIIWNLKIDELDKV